ncbi:helicase associated domain-containing protein [Embleya sp. NPDC050154]|uniref:helicase associated domain-containing protein n=1 Tax=Embleya sp. NPDC050154 TaxID=3363988 RepID=UPI0037AFB36C
MAADPAVLQPPRPRPDRPLRRNARRRPAITQLAPRPARRRAHPDLRVPLDAVDIDHLGGWISEQRREYAAGRLNTKQVEKLNKLGMVWSLLDQAWNDGAAQQAAATGAGQAQAVAEPSGPKPKRTREQAFEIALGAATVYRERVGHLEVPRGHVESVVAFDGWREDVRLGVWITTTKSRRAKLPAERITALDALGMRWT